MIHRFISWFNGRCWHRWSAWGDVEQLTLGTKGREVLPSGNILLHGQRIVTIQWHRCERCGIEDYRHLYGRAAAQAMETRRAETAGLGAQQNTGSPKSNLNSEAGMTEKPENPPAFPHVNPNYDGNWNKEPQRGGMSLRDWFAGQVLGSLCVSYSDGEAYSHIAETAYRQADAMLRARASKDQPQNGGE